VIRARTQQRNPAVTSHPIAPDTLTEVTQLLDDLTQLLDISAAHAQPNHRRRAMEVAGHIRLLRNRLAPADQNPPRRTPGHWYAKLAAALGATSNLPDAVLTDLTDQLDQLEQAIDPAFSRRRRRWRPTNRRPDRPPDT
jgi:hypothetical protein